MILFYVSGHGFGHATRAVALVRALRARQPRAEIAVVSDAPSWIFTDADPKVRCFKAAIDPGLFQMSGLDVDLPRSLKAHEMFIAGWDRAVEREGCRIRRLGAALVVGDIPPLAFAAAHGAGVKSVAVANFSWDWILSRYVALQPRWEAIIRRYGAAYSFADELFRLPMAPDDFAAFRKSTPIPFLVNRCEFKKDEARRRLAIKDSDRRRLVLITFGGFGSGPLSAGRGDDMSDTLFAGFGPKPKGLAAGWLGLARRLKFPHVNVVAACDALIGKPGYGTFAEAFAHRKPILYLPRENFAETPVLIEWMQKRGCARPIARDRFFKGLWRAELDALMAENQSWASLPLNGAEVLAERLAGFVKISRW